MRPCISRHIELDHKNCRMCQLEVINPDYWNGFKPRHKNIVSAQPLIQIPCQYEGAILEWCHLCRGEMRHIRECDIHEKCTRGDRTKLVQCCSDCKDYIPVELGSV